MRRRFPVAVAALFLTSVDTRALSESIQGRSRPVPAVHVAGSGVDHLDTAIVHSKKDTPTGMIQKSTETVDLEGSLNGRSCFTREPSSAHLKRPTSSAIITKWMTSATSDGQESARCGLDAPVIRTGYSLNVRSGNSARYAGAVFKPRSVVPVQQARPFGGIFQA